MKTSGILLSAGAFLVFAFVASDASATVNGSRAARVAAALGFPLTNPALGNTQGTLADGYACFTTQGLSSGGNGSIARSSGTCRGSSTAYWVMPVHTEIHAAATAIVAYVVTTGSPTVYMNTFDYAGTFSSGSGALTPVSPQTNLPATVPIGGYAEIFALLGSGQTVADYAYEYDY